MRQLSKISETRFVEVNARLGFVGKAQLAQPLYLGDDLRDILSGASIIVDVGDPQSAHVFQVSLLELARQRSGTNARLRSSLDDLVVHVCDVLQVEDAKALIFEIACHHIEGDVGSGMTDVRIVVNCRTADK